MITNADKAMDENPKFKNSKPDQEYAFLQLKIRFFMGMIHCRMNEKSNTSLRNYFISDLKEFQGILDYISLEPIAAKWFYIFNVIFTSQKEILFLNRREFYKQLEDIKSRVKSRNELEKLCKTELDVFIKDISIEGHLDLLIHDFVSAKQLTKGNTV